MKSRHLPLLPGLAVARSTIQEVAPYYLAGVYRMQPTVCEGLDTFAVDSSGRLYFDPAIVDKLALTPTGAHQLAAVLVHELLHLLDRHCERAQAAGVVTPEDAAIWNVAADLALWSILAESKPPWRLRGAVTPHALKLKPGMPVEAYYAALKRMGSAALPPDHAGPPGQPRPGRGACGSCANGRPAAWEQPPQAESLDEGQARVDLLRYLVAQAVTAHAKARGSVPAELLRLAEQTLLPSVIPWKRVLAGIVRGRLAVPGRDDYSRARPSRRQQSTPNVLRPALVRSAPRATVVVDTSGSMGESDLTVALSESRGLLRAAGSDITVLAVDSKVGCCRAVNRVDQIKLVGGGGTDMRVGIRAAARANPAPDLIVVITDGWTPWDSASPVTIPVVVLLVGDQPAALSTVPTWTRAMHVPPQEQDIK